MKHALLVWLLRALAAKEKPFRVLDTHAGIGSYDLSAASEAERTGEWRRGIGRLLDIEDGPLADYVALVRAAGAPARYPGLPRPGRRACCGRRTTCWPASCTRTTHATLRAAFRRDAQVAVHHRDGWEALKALTPFPEKRGLVLVDPPFEQEGEFERLAAGHRPGLASASAARSRPAGTRSSTAPRCAPSTPRCRSRAARPGRRRALAARADRPAAAERLRPAGRQPALEIRGGGRRHPGRAAGAAGRWRARPGLGHDPDRGGIDGSGSPSSAPAPGAPRWPCRRRGRGRR